jgi:hypothetical protein
MRLPFGKMAPFRRWVDIRIPITALPRTSISCSRKSPVSEGSAGDLRRRKSEAVANRAKAWLFIGMIGQPNISIVWHKLVGNVVVHVGIAIASRVKFISFEDLIRNFTDSLLGHHFFGRGQPRCPACRVSWGYLKMPRIALRRLRSRFLSNERLSSDNSLRSISTKESQVR